MKRKFIHVPQSGVVGEGGSMFALDSLYIRFGILDHKMMIVSHVPTL